MEIRSLIPTLTDLIDYFPRLNILNKQDIDDELSELRNNMGELCFKNIANFAMNNLSLPTSNVDVE